MPDEPKWSDYSFNIIKHRGSPNKATTLKGIEVEKSEYVYYRRPGDGMMVAVRCADYHNEHFLYINPEFNEEGEKMKPGWFAMCTCGSPAVLIGEGLSGAEDMAGHVNQLLVCYVHQKTLLETGTGRHATGDGRRWL